MRDASRIAAALMLGLTLGAFEWPGQAAAQTPYIVTPVAEKKVSHLPSGQLFWRVETFPSVALAKAAAGVEGWNPDSVSYEATPSLVAEVAGKVWLFTLGAKGASTPGGSKVAEIGPIPPISAPEYLLRVNYGHGPAGARTATHSHPGSEAFYVVEGRLGQKTAGGVTNVEAGQTQNGQSSNVPMEVFNSGTGELTALIMFVVDATKPFSTPAKLD